MTDPHHPFSDAVALADDPVSRHGSSVLLFIDSWENDLGRSEGQPSADPQRSASSEEGTTSSTASGEEEVISGR